MVIALSVRMMFPCGTRRRSGGKEKTKTNVSKKRPPFLSPLSSRLRRVYATAQHRRKLTRLVKGRRAGEGEKTGGAGASLREKLENQVERGVALPKGEDDDAVGAELPDVSLHSGVGLFATVGEGERGGWRRAAGGAWETV